MSHTAYNVVSLVDRLPEDIESIAWSGIVSFLLINICYTHLQATYYETRTDVVHSQLFEHTVVNSKTQIFRSINSQLFLLKLKCLLNSVSSLFYRSVLVCWRIIRNAAAVSRYDKRQFVLKIIIYRYVR